MRVGSNQPLVESVGVAMEVIRNNNGGFESEYIARIIRDVVVEKVGEAVRKKARARASPDIEGEAKAQKKAHDNKLARP